MKNLLFITLFFFIISCSNTKTVLICGDHVCINKNEAEQYFEENLSIEVKILDKDEKNKIDLVELNLKLDEKEKRSVSIAEKKDTNKTIKILSNDEIKRKKTELKEKVRINKLKDKKKKKDKFQVSKIKKKKIDNSTGAQKTKSKSQIQIIDVCLILEKCNIDEISKFLIEQGKKKKFPDITLRE